MEENLGYRKIWRTATIFISSTFRDMQYERDCINEIVVPALKDYFKFYKIAVRTIDLRWGINTIDNKENDVEGRILSVCMDEIDRSRPFFVGIVGDRYGWMPSFSMNPEDKSVTEMEIDYGALRNKESLENAVICLRDLNNVPEELHSIYYEEDAAKLNKVKKLREHLSDIYSDLSIKRNFTRYAASWNPETETLSGLSSLSDFLIDTLKRLITQRFGLVTELRTGEHVSDYAILDSFFGDYINSCLTACIPRPDLEKDAAESVLESGLCYIAGNQGNGKSVMLCRLSELLADSFDIILYYNEALSTSPDRRLECMTVWDYALSSFLSLDFEESAPGVGSAMMFSRKLVARSDMKFRLTRLQDMAGKLAGKYKVICLIDTAEHIKDDFIRLLRDSLPYFSFAVAISSTSLQNCGVKIIEIPPFGKDEISGYLIRKFEYYGKTLHYSVMDAIVRKIASKIGNALWLSVMTYLFLNLNAKDFAAISMNREKKGEASIEDYFLALVKEAPDNPSDLFRYLYDRLILRFDDSVITPVLSYLCVSKNGLRDEDLERLLGERWDPIQFASFRRWFSPFLAESPDNKRWKFVFPLFKNSVSSLNITDSREDEKALAGLLWHYDFYDPVRYSDLFHHLVNSGMYSRCGQLIIASNVNYIEPIKETFDSITDGKDVEMLVNNISAALSTEDRILAVSKLLILIVHNLFYENIRMVRNIVDELVQDIDVKQLSVSESAFVSLSVLLEEVILFVEKSENHSDSVKYSDLLLSVALCQDGVYPSKDSRAAVSKSAYALGKHYLMVGDSERANEYFKLI